MLNHVVPVIATNVINFEMDLTLTTPLTLTELTVAAGLKQVNIDSTGTASDNVITDVGSVADNITVTGATPLTLGSAAAAGDAYALPAGTIDASGTAAGGGVTAFLHPTSGAAQTFLAGHAGTTNEAIYTTGAGGVADFTLGGADTVQFNVVSPNSAATSPIADTGHLFNDVNSTATDAIINISTGGIPTVYTDTGLGVAAGDTTSPFPFTTGTGVSAVTAHDNLIVINGPPPTASTPLESVQGVFHDAIGATVADGIATGAAIGSHILVSFYDTTTSQAVLAAATTVGPGVIGGTSAIDNASPVAVVGLIHETAAQYAAIASNLHFVA